MRRTADQLVVAATRRGGGDFVAEVAAAYSFQTMARVLGIPEQTAALAELVAAALDDATAKPTQRTTRSAATATGQGGAA